MGSAGRICSSRNAPTRLASSADRDDGGGIISASSLTSIGLRQQVKVVPGIAEHGGDRGDALEIMSDFILHRHPHAAVQLDRLLADDAARIAYLHLRRGDCLAPLAGIVAVGGHGSE